MTALDQLRAKVEALRRDHGPYDAEWASDCCRRCRCPRPCETLQGWEAALKLAEALEKLTSDPGALLLAQHREALDALAAVAAMTGVDDE